MMVKWLTACPDGDHCVRVGYYGVTDAFVIGDSKNPDGAQLEFTREEFTNFVNAVKNGEMDHVLQSE